MSYASAPLQGFTQKQDGLVNASDIAKTRIENPKDHLKRDQEVWVKVISMAGGRIRLSMRDVDQKTGVDLVPMGKANEGGANFCLLALAILKATQTSRAVLTEPYQAMCHLLASQDSDNSIQHMWTKACDIWQALFFMLSNLTLYMLSETS